MLWKLNLIKTNQINNKYETPYEETIDQITNLILKCDLAEINNIRNLIYNLIITNIEPTNILRNIFTNLCKKKGITEKKKLKIINIASIYDHNLVRRRREIIHIEGFIINTMNLLLDNE